MLIPLGFLAASGVSAGSFDLLETQVLGSTTSSVTFSSLSTYAATYQHLQVRMALGTSTGSSIKFQLNADTASNYSFHRLEGNGSSVVSAAETPQTAMFAGYIFSETASGVIDLLDAFETTKNKTARTLWGNTTSGGHRVYLSSGHWRNTNATTAIKLLNESGNFTVGSRFSLYGIRAS